MHLSKRANMLHDRATVSLPSKNVKQLIPKTLLISEAAKQKNCALFDKSTKFGTHVEYHQINIFGYGGAHKCTHGDHSNGFLKWQP